MMRLILSFLVTFSIFLTASAQPQKSKNSHDKPDFAKIEAYKSAFISRKLDLSPDESQKFWPVYNEYSKELSMLYRKRPDNDNERSLHEIDFEQRLLDIKKIYRKKFLAVVPEEKVLALYKAEREFRDMLIREMRGRRGN